MLESRSSGVLMHISSLPGQYGIGDIGHGAYEFIDFLVRSGQTYWQILPTVPVDDIYGGSPYMGFAANAGNPLFISPDILLEEGLLQVGDVPQNAGGFSEYNVDSKHVSLFKKGLLDIAFKCFLQDGSSDKFTVFCEQEKDWLDDYALFMALKESFGHESWHNWPYLLASRQKEALSCARLDCRERIIYYKFEQFCFFSQWGKLHDYARKNGVSLIGDMPIYVSFDSADVWANHSCFRLYKKSLTPTHVAGVPPDYFSETGQRWGNPLYRWRLDNKKNIRLYRWWKKRFAKIAEMVDVVRIDHFRGFESYWQIPAAEKTAINGCWRKGPGISFFKEMALKDLGLDIIAEDLGEITPAVESLRDDLGFPGMKILQFAFDSGAENNYLPHNYKSSSCVVYTGTHDNDTTLGWFMGDASSVITKENVRRYANTKDDGQIHWDLIRVAFGSIAALAIIPMQDILGFGEDCRMNIPGTSEGNWSWRCAARFFSDEIALRLKNEATFYGRNLVMSAKAKAAQS